MVDNEPNVTGSEQYTLLVIDLGQFSREYLCQTETRHFIMLMMELMMKRQH